MRVSVHLPDDYSSSVEYPVLYFIPYAGGGPGIVPHFIETNSEVRDAFRSGALHPLIVVGVPHDGSFLLNSDPPWDEVVVAGVPLHRGLYESFFLDELIPSIEQKYSASQDAAKRYIGGYSLGGHAALRIALCYPGLFYRVGGHSPTLFDGPLENVELESFLYPTVDLRQARDPIELARVAAPSEDVRFYIDTGPYDINVEGCELFYQRLVDAGVAAEFHLLRGTHGVDYLEEHMPEYLEFYAGADKAASVGE